MYIILMYICYLGFGLPYPFTEAPRDPTYVSTSSVAKLKWNFKIHGNFERVRIKFKKSGSFVPLMDKYENGRVVKSSFVPNNFTSRITIEGNATLVITKVSALDARRYSCAFYPLTGAQTQDVSAQLIVTGETF